MKRILLLINPRSRNGNDAYSGLQQVLEASGNHIIPLSEDERVLNPQELIKRFTPQIDLVLIGGGDGSVNMALPALLECQLPLVVYPLGTANNLARTYELPSRPEDIAELIQTGTIETIDVGEVNQIPFLSVAGLGLSTEINQRTPAWLKKWLGVGAFALTALRMIFSMNPFRVEITQNQQMTLKRKSWQVTVCNGKYYGAGMVIKHDATLVDGKLHCLSTEVDHWWRGFLLLPALFSGRFRKNHEVTLLGGSEFSLITRRKFLIDVDGDIKTQTPATFRVLPAKLKLLISSRSTS